MRETVFKADGVQGKRCFFSLPFKMTFICWCLADPSAEQHHVDESERAGEMGGIYLFCVISLLHLFFLYVLVCVSVGFEIHAMNIL